MPPQSTLDIQAARARASFDPDALHRVLLNGSKDPAMRRRITEILEQNPSFDKGASPYQSRAQQIERGLHLAKALFEVVDKHDLDYIEYLEALFASDTPMGLNLHEIAFTPVIQSQGSDEQQEEWLPRCYNHEILGCYLQPFRFVAYRLDRWIGALGILSTHGVVQARLMLGGKDYGPHLFIVQLRSEKDHSLMPGIQAGEIGPKVHGAMASVDNGWARFNHVRVPRSHMLSRFAQVDPVDGGRFIKPPHSKLSYGGMIFIRSQMIGNLSWRLAKAVTISIRYLHMRRQFADPELKPGEPQHGIEKQVITYPAVYMRVIPQLANCIVFMTMGKDMANLYHSMSAQLASGDTALLAETHAVSSGLKTYVSSGVVDGTEVVRRAMGGHGFLASSGVGRIFATELPSATILNLQVARAALKSFRAFLTAANPADARARLTPSTAYLASLATASSLPLAPPSSADGWLDLAYLQRLLSLRAALCVARLAAQLDSGRKFGELSWECVEVSAATVEAFIAARMGEALLHEGGVLREGVGAAEGEVLKNVVTFFLLHRVSCALPSLLEFGILAPPAPPSLAKLGRSVANSPLEQLRLALDKLAREILPERVGLTDAFGFSDWELDSVAGLHSGGVYEAMLSKAQADEQLNIGDKAEQERLYREYIRPILERGRRLNGRNADGAERDSKL
ncbi:hypothetical protein Rhopal_007004-T1 [Rhodotorula paludigena]|uniref:Acyl-coenzyme A oxidase n=1 Tax=Rhodotorula paludigena TaxID=86838 RepID=A0AAV5GWT8_9BASI|nr:hypothetical protein Rhopal_007004-T1 [Rhodotorula paludigena]